MTETTEKRVAMGGTSPPPFQPLYTMVSFLMTGSNNKKSLRSVGGSLSTRHNYTDRVMCMMCL